MNIEPLEARIAPAVFFLSGTALTVEDAAGNDAENLPVESAARAAAGATKALLLQAGDLLVFDEDNDNIRDPLERVLIQVQAGRAMVFLSDGFGPTAGAFDENEISGLAVSDGFRAIIRTDVNGSIATTLDTANNLQTTVQNSSIAGLQIAGRVAGSVVAGKNLSNLAIGSGLFTTTAELSAQALATGTGATGVLAKYSLSGATFNLVFNQPAGAPGGSITNVRLENGALLVEAGEGGDAAGSAGHGGRGGSITRLVMVDAPGAIHVFAGCGGFSLNGISGGGGSIIDSSFVFEGDVNLESRVQAGPGESSPNGVAGAGGSILRTTVHQLGDGLSLIVTGGGGGDSAGLGIPGRGGAISASTIITAGNIGSVNGSTLNGGTVRIAGGGGGFGNSGGAAGGALIGTKVQILNSEAVVPFLSIKAGTGGASSLRNGAAGGAFSGNGILVTAHIGLHVGASNEGSAVIGAGGGGHGFRAGGAGGAMSGNSVQILSGVTLTNGNQLRIAAGDGGGIEGPGTAGAGGASINNRVRLGDVGLGTFIGGGAGGADETPADAGSGGRGGALTGLQLESIGFLAGLTVSSGAGGAAGTVGKGGAGGAVSSLVADLRGVVDSFFAIAAGDGGAGGSVQGQGGGGGSFATATIRVNDINTTATIRAGSSGVTRGASSLAGGALTGVVFENVGQLDTLVIRSGGGGDILSGTGVAGGNGAMNGVIVTNLGGANFLRIGGTDQATHQGAGSAANAGAISNVTVFNLARLGDLHILGNDGGFAGSAGGNGGAGGALRKIVVSDSAGVTGEVVLRSGVGGLGRGADKVGGPGGAIAHITLSGPDTLFTIEAGDGGNGVARGGGGGTITMVRGAVRDVSLLAGTGGAANFGSGGAGGAVKQIDFGTVLNFVRRIVAGDGGDGTIIGGAGGAIDGVRVVGDIGDFDATFGAEAGEMGGLFAGQAGVGGTALNGSVANIVAKRIATIAAGTPNANTLTAGNAVHSLKAINAFILGADEDGDGIFDFDDFGGAGFRLGDGDLAVDGLVVARLQADLHALPVRPLFAASLVAAAAPVAALPGTYFLSATGLTVKDAAGANAQNTAAENAAQTVSGATRAFLLKAGETLIFDENNNNLRDPQERVLVSVAAGQAMVFLSDGFGASANAFDENEISGLAVSHGFKGAVRSDVNGSVTTTLDAAGNFTPTVLQSSAIDTLSVAGRVSGIIASGRDMTLVNLGSGLFTDTAEASARALLTGSAAAGAIAKYSFVPTPVGTLTFTQPAATSAGSISKVRLENGVAQILAGSGGASAGDAAGGAGGSIREVVMVDGADFSVVLAGHGGTSTAGPGGAGGSILKSVFRYRSSVPGDPAFFGAGGGGDGRIGGAGGRFDQTTVHQLEDRLELTALAGDGGRTTGGTGAGGRGGSIMASNFIVAGSLGVVAGGFVSGGDFNVLAGNGGSGPTGGAGGSIANSKVQSLDSGGAIVSLLFKAGAGGEGSGHAGGTGGALSGNTVRVHSELGVDPGIGAVGSLNMSAGVGGGSNTSGGNGGAFLNNRIDVFGRFSSASPLTLEAGAGANVTGTGTGGSGGSFAGSTVRLGEINTAVILRGGNGGHDGTASDPGSGGHGGALTTLSLDTFGGMGQLSIAAGKGGNAGTGGNGGNGGALTDVVMRLSSVVADGVAISAGDGGTAGSAAGFGGAGGALARVQMKVGEVDDGVIISGGDAANSRDRNGRNGGNVSDVSIENAGLLDDLEIVPGAGAALLSGTGNGGVNGAVSRISVNNLGGAAQVDIGTNSVRNHSGTGTGVKGASMLEITVRNFGGTDHLEISGGLGGSGGDLGGDGGLGGSVSKVVLRDPVGIPSVVIAAAQIGDGQGPTGKGAASGNVGDVLLDAPDAAVRIVTGGGGDGVIGGGKGGSISNIRGVVGQLRVAAGSGGDATVVGRAGAAGGSVSDINISAVGDFVRHIIAGDGGSSPTLGGAGGSISRVAVVGDIGNFDAPFGAGAAAMGGLFAGRAGDGGAAQNGSISQVTATRIAAILAGRPGTGAVTAANAVHSLAAISSFILGADVNADGVFAFTDAPPIAGFSLGQGDTALDGLVLTRLGSQLATLPVRPLFAISLVP